MMKLGAARDVREEDFAAGKAWVHPETCLEYEDFGSWLAGEAPLDHWRNRRIQALGSADLGKDLALARAQEIFALYDCHGNRKHQPRRNSAATYGFGWVSDPC